MGRQISIEEALEKWDKADNTLRCEFLHRVHWVGGKFNPNWSGYDMTAAIAGYFRDKEN
jgi:hypothetical protein